VTPREEMKMNVEYRLAGAGIIVIDYPEPIFRNSALPRYQGGHLKDMADEGIVLLIEIQGVYEMFPGNEQNVTWCDRSNVLNGNDQFILKDFLCGDFSLDDLAENTVAQSTLHLPAAYSEASARIQSIMQCWPGEAMKLNCVCILH
jgi:hypothetical protein